MRTLNFVSGGSLVLIARAFAGCEIPLAVPQPKPTDAEIRQRLVGKWNEVTSGGGVKSQTVNEFTTEGRFKTEGTMTIDGAESPQAYTGTWTVSGGVLTYTIQTSQPDVFEPGETVQDEVLGIDDREFRYRNPDGELVTMTRLSQ